jgi:hypothetical protein
VEIDPENDPNQPTGAAIVYLIIAAVIVAAVIAGVLIGKSRLFWF